MTHETKPSERRRNKTRQDILDAAHAMIVERGVEGLSLRAVSDQLDYSPAALYRHYGSKDELVDAIRAQCFERLNTAIFQRVASANGAVEQLLAGGLAYIDFARQYPIDFHLMFHFAPSASTQAENRQTAMRALLFLVRGGIESGEFVTAETYNEDAITLHCWATVHGIAILQTTVARDEPGATVTTIETILRKVIAGFTAAS